MSLGDKAFIKPSNMSVLPLDIGKGSLLARIGYMNHREPVLGVVMWV